MPSFHAGFVTESVPMDEENYRVLREWADRHDRTVPQILASLARDAARAIQKVGVDQAVDNLDPVTMPSQPKTATVQATHPEHIALLGELDRLGLPHPMLSRGWNKRRMADFTAVIRTLFNQGWNDQRLADLLGFTPSGMLEERRRLGLFRQPATVTVERRTAAIEAWENDPRREALGVYGLDFPPLRPGADRLTCRDFRPAIGKLVSDFHLNDREIGALISYGGAAVSLERRALNLTAATARRGAVYAEAS